MRHWWLCLIGLTIATSVFAQDRETKVRNDKKLLEGSDFWIYNDLPKGMKRAASLKKPLLLVFRCIPCEACHEFDEQVVEREPRIRELLGQFVCVRIPQANGMDLSKFQFDYDMSFAVFYLHHDGSILGRFGTRTGRENERDDMQLEGFAESMQRALALSRDFESVKTVLAGKRGPDSPIASPEKFPEFRGKYTDQLNYEGKVVQSCIHCHQVREAQRLVHRAAGEPIPDAVLFPWPSLSIIGVKCDPKTATTVSGIDSGSLADQTGLKAGDRLVSFNGQPLVSVADAQWVLQQTGREGTIDVVAERGGQTVSLRLKLPTDWRRANDISWRTTTWDLRRLAFGGMLPVALTPAERAELQLPTDKLALRVQHVGEYGEHARAKKAGVRKGDILTAYDGRTDFRTETEILAYALQQRKPGEDVTMTFLRDGQPVQLTVDLP